jgi:ACR3 family arsenite efflux pump ArsB
MQIFPHAANTVSRASIALAVALAIGIPVVVAILQRSSCATGVGVPRLQTVPFSHKHDHALLTR